MARVGAGSVGWDGAAQPARKVNISRKISGVREEVLLINMIVFTSVYSMGNSYIDWGVTTEVVTTITFSGMSLRAKEPALSITKGSSLPPCRGIASLAQNAESRNDNPV
jgi:hypothetical protein